MPLPTSGRVIPHSGFGQDTAFCSYQLALGIATAVKSTLCFFNTAIRFALPRCRCSHRSFNSWVYACTAITMRSTAPAYERCHGLIFRPVPEPAFSPLLANTCHVGFYHIIRLPFFGSSLPCLSLGEKPIPFGIFSGMRLSPSFTTQDQKTVRANPNVCGGLLWQIYCITPKNLTGWSKGNDAASPFFRLRRNLWIT